MHHLLKQLEEKTLREVDRLERLVPAPLHLTSKDGSPLSAVGMNLALPSPVSPKEIEFDEESPKVSPHDPARESVSKRLNRISPRQPRLSGGITGISVGDERGPPSPRNSDHGGEERAVTEYVMQTKTKVFEPEDEEAFKPCLTRAQVQLAEAIKMSHGSMPPILTNDGSSFWTRMWRDKRLMGLVLDSFMGIVIILNCAAIGISSDVHPLWDGWIAIDGVFAVIFVVEFGLQLHLQGGREYWCGPDQRWHLFEVALVVLAVLEVGLALINHAGGSEGGGANNFSLFRIMRLVRITRLLRVCKLELFCDLIVMVKGTLGGIKTLMWSVVLISLPLYAVSLLFRETLGTKWADGDGAEAFKNVPLSLFTVFRCIVAGECTDMKGRPLFSLIVENHGWGYGMIYCATEVFMTFGLFNVIVAIFVENVLAGAKTNDQMMKRQRLRDEAFWSTKIFEMSTLICSHHRRMSGEHGTETEPSSPDVLLMEAQAIQITPELYDHLKKDAEFADILRDLDVHDEDSQHLFDTLDADVSGSIDIEELLVGIEKLRGEARRSDIVSVNLKVNNMMKLFDEQFKQLNVRLSKYEANLETLVRKLC